MTDTDATDLALASIGRRFVARLLDGLIFTGPLLIYLLTRPQPDPGETIEIASWVNAAFLATSTVYEVAMVSWRGQTLGKIALGIRIVRIADGRVPTPAQAAIRFLLPTAVAAIPIPVLSVVALLIYVSAVWDPRRRGYHDKAAGTIVLANTA